MLLKDVVPAIGARRIDDVSRRDIARILDSVAERGPIMANRTLAYMRRFFNWSVERGYIDASPCAGTKSPAAARSRERTLDDGELVEVWRAADALGGPWAPLTLMLILTAQRRSEVAEMRWSESDLERRTWTISGE